MPSSSARVRPHTIVRAVALLGGLIALLLGALSTSAAAAPYPPKAGCTVSTTTAKAGPGSAVTFIGSGFAAKQTVTLSIPSAWAALGTVTTNDAGSFSGTFTWPASVSGKSAKVQASAPSTTCSFTLVNAKSSSGTIGGSRASGASTNGSGLSSTGFQALTATGIALALIGAGALFLGLARRKRV